MRSFTVTDEAIWICNSYTDCIPVTVDGMKGRSDCLRIHLHGFIVANWFVCTCHCLMSAFPFNSLDCLINCTWNLAWFGYRRRHPPMGQPKEPMVWFNGWDQQPGQKVEDEETGTEQERRKRGKRRQRLGETKWLAEPWRWFKCGEQGLWYTRLVVRGTLMSRHLSSATLDSRFF